MEGEGVRVHLASRTPASAFAAPLCACFNRQPSLGRRLCGRNRGILDRQSTGVGNELKSAGRALSAIHEDLDCDLPTLRALVEESGRELAAEIATDVLIIEDETFIAMDIEALVESLGHNVIGIARTHSEALALAKQKRPGLILADIQLADGSSGLDAVNELLGSFEVPVIFITAYPERFLTGQRPEPAFLIAKPFQVAVVSAVVSQALFFGRKARQRERKPSERQATL